MEEKGEVSRGGSRLSKVGTVVFLLSVAIAAMSAIAYVLLRKT